MRNLSKRLLAATAAATMLFGTVITANAAQEDLFDAQYYAEAYPDIAAAVGNDENALLQHYLNYGITEGRSASAYFNALAYKTANADLAAAFGDDWDAYADHYIQSGVAEGRYSGGTRAITDAEYAAAAEKLAGTTNTTTAETQEAQTAANETEATETGNGIYVVKKAFDPSNYNIIEGNTVVGHQSYEWIKNCDIEIYRLGGNSDFVWNTDDYENLGCENAEDAAALYGIFLDDISFVTRTDFPDGLIDTDGNGIDDRDPINGMGFIDLNHNGIDDRQRYMQWDLDFIKTDTSVSFSDVNAVYLYGESYLCPHNIVCSTANPYKSYVYLCTCVSSFYQEKGEIYLDVQCPICNSMAYEAKSIGDKMLEATDAATGSPKADKLFGYKPGDTVTLTDGSVWTYLGWVSEESPLGGEVWGDSWISDSGKKGTTGVRYKPGSSFDEIYNSRTIIIWY